MYTTKKYCTISSPLILLYFLVAWENNLFRWKWKNDLCIFLTKTYCLLMAVGSQLFPIFIKERTKRKGWRCSGKAMLGCLYSRKPVTQQIGNYHFFSKMRDQYEKDQPVYKPLLIVHLPQARSTIRLLSSWCLICTSKVKIIFICWKNRTLFQKNLSFWCFVTYSL